MSVQDWIVVYCLVTIPIGSLWLWAEIVSLRERRRREGRSRSLLARWRRRRSLGGKL